ncbi:MAG TPA: DUF2306 domain-containing protein [Thermoanaerobaculia bacterium]|nr:DUF2306 domain-containing protein [Thermoanaerobaculia bacterium]
MARALWLAVVLLVLIGVAAALGRGLFPADFITRAEPFRQQFLQALGRHDSDPAQRAIELQRVDARYGAHRLATFLHIVPGALFLVLAPLQFSTRIRTRHLRFHRWSGRLLVILALPMVAAGFYFGVLMPYAGVREAIVIASVATLFIASLTRAVIAIRRRDVARHREWMLRAFALAIGISVVRLVAAVVDTTLTPAGYDLRGMFVLSLAGGWALSSAAAEAWIARSASVPVNEIHKEPSA